jgi:hypothetical protein
MSSAAQNRLGRFFQRVRNRFAPDTRIHLLKVRKMDKEDCCMICGDKAEETTTLIQPCRTCMGYWCMRHSSKLSNLFLEDALVIPENLESRSLTFLGINCVRLQCQNASRTLGDMPPRCCREMDPRLILKHLDDDGDQKRYKELFHEYRTEVKDRVYCPNVQCGILITQYTIKRQRLDCLINDESKAKKHDSGMPADDHITNCPQCSTMICLTCKKDAHNGSPCQLDEDPAIAQLRKFGYKRCPRCGYGTRRMWGCSHMKCVCGAHWCWSCERNFAVCDALGGCDDYEEEDEDPETDDEHAEHDEHDKHAVEDANEAQNMDPVITEAGAEGKQTEDTNETGQNLVSSGEQKAV